MSTISTNTGQTKVIYTGYGMYDRDFRKKLQITSPNYSDFGILRQLKLLNKLKPSEKTQNHEFYYWQQRDHLNASATIADIDISVPNQVTITLSAKDHFDAGKFSYPIPNDTIVFSNQITANVFDVDKTIPNAHKVIIRSSSGTNDVHSAALRNSVVVFYGSAVGEASRSLQSRLTTFDKVVQNLKTNRADFKVTDHAMQNKVEFEDSETGTQYVYPINLRNTADRFEMGEEYSMLIERKGQSVDKNGDTVYNSQGLIPEVYDNGMTKDYFNQVDFDTWGDINLDITNAYGDGEYMCLNGIEFGIGTQSWMSEYTKHDATYAFFQGGKEQALNFNFTALRMPGIGLEVYFKDCQSFKHAKTLGDDNLIYKKLALMIPCGGALNQKTNEMMPYLQIRYAEPQGARHQVQGDIMVFETGALASKGATNDIIERNYTMVSYKALQMFQIQKFMVIQPDTFN